MPFSVKNLPDDSKMDLGPALEPSWGRLEASWKWIGAFEGRLWVSWEWLRNVFENLLEAS